MRKMGRTPCCSEEGLHRGHWSAREDTFLTTYIEANGEGQWRSLPKKAGLLRCGKSCRLRWLNYLRPGIKRGNITPDEDDLIIRLHSLLGNRWSLIAGRLPGRTDNEIKNHWHTHLSKRVKNTKTELNLHKQVQKRGPEPKKRNKKNGIADGDVVTVSKIYHPKPNRPVNNSTTFNNQASCSMSYGEADAGGDGNVKLCDKEPNLISGCDLSIQCSLLKNDNTLQKLYDEFLQLL